MNAVNINSPRGTVIKVPDATPGILVVSGKQYLFTLESVWKSAMAPSPNQPVAIELDSAGGLSAITVIDPQQVAKERLGELGTVAQARGRELIEQLRPVLAAMTARMGAVTLGAAVLVWIASYWLPAGGLAGGESAWGSYSFRTLLGTDLGDPGSLASPGHARGLLRFLAFVAIAVPFTVPFIRSTWSRYLNAAPFAAVLVGWLVIHENVVKSFGGVPGMENPFGFKWGFYVLVIACLALASGALKKPAGQHT